MSFNQLREQCFFKTGREGVVLEVIDFLQPNLFDDNKNIDNSIFNKNSKIRFTLIDARKTQGKGRALYYNLDPNEILLLAHLLSDGIPSHFKKRVGAYNNLSGQNQIYIRSFVETFDAINFARFDKIIKEYYSKGPEGTAIIFQKNIDIGKNNLLVRKFILSYEEAIKSASKWKITIEIGEAIKDVSKGNGLNIIKQGTYKMTDKTFLMLQADEVVIPVNEASKRVILSQGIFYSLMKEAQKKFTEKKLENEDFDGERIDEWNPQGKSKWDDIDDKNDDEETITKTTKQKNTQPNKTTKKKTQKGNIDEKICSDCGTNIDDNVYNYSMKFHKKPLCIKCQKK